MKILAKTLAPDLSKDNFQISSVEDMAIPKEHFDVVICSAVLHFARDELHSSEMLNQMWKTLKGGGLLFARMASSIGIEDRIQRIQKRRYLLPDGSERFLVDEDLLISISKELGGIWLEPLKTTNVQNLRCMSTWVLRKNIN